MRRSRRRAGAASRAAGASRRRRGAGPTRCLSCSQVGAVAPVWACMRVGEWVMAGSARHHPPLSLACPTAPPAAPPLLLHWRRRGHARDECGRAAGDWHGRLAQRHRPVHHGDPLPPLPLQRHHQVRHLARMLAVHCLPALPACSGCSTAWLLRQEGGEGADGRQRQARHPTLDPQAAPSNHHPHTACAPPAPCPLHACRVEMRDESRLLFVDEFALSFHLHFYRCGRRRAARVLGTGG